MTKTDAWLMAAVSGLFAVLLLAMCGCGTWQQRTHQTLDSIYETTKGVSQVSEVYFRDKCLTEAKQCGGVVCDELKKCQAQRDELNKAVVVIHRTIIVGKLAVEAANYKKATDVTTQVLQAIYQLSEMLRQYGIVAI